MSLLVSQVRKSEEGEDRMKIRVKLTLYVCRESKKEEDRKMICGVYLLMVWSC